MKKLLLPVFFALCALVANAQRIAVMCDIHVSPGNANAGQLQLAVDEINASHFDMVVVDGDLTNEGSDAELAYVKSILDGIRHPLYLVPGNHENNWSQSATKTFFDLWGNDRFCTVLPASDCDYVVVGMNCGPFMKMGDGHVKQEDLHWMQHTLDSLTCIPDSRAKKVVSFNHYPIRKDDLDNYAEYSELLHRYPVCIHINGHYHAWDRYDISGIGAVTARALSLDGTYGYTIVDLADDRVDVYEKITGADAPSLKYTIAGCNDPSSFRAEHAEDASPAMPVPFHADEASVFTRLAFDDECVFFGNSLGVVKALDKHTGVERWHHCTGALLFSRPVVLGDNIAVPHASGILILDRRTGDVVADHPSARGPYVADGMLVLPDSLYIQGGYKRMECRRASDGASVWTFDSIANYCQGAPAVDGNDVVFGAWDTYLRCLDLHDGSLKWKWSNGKTNNLLSPGNVVPVLTPDKVIIVAPDRFMTAIDRQSGQTIWRDNSHRYRESLGCSEDGTRVYAKTMDGELVAVDATAAEFRELWVCDMGLGYEHAPCIVAERDGVVYAGSRRGIVTAVSADTQPMTAGLQPEHRLLWQKQTGTSEVNGIDIDPTDGSVWVSLVEGKIHKF